MHVVLLNPPRKRRNTMRKVRRRSSRRLSGRRRKRNYSHWIPAYRNNPRRKGKRRGSKRRSKRRSKRNSYYTPRMAMNKRRRRGKKRRLNSRRRKSSFRYRSNKRKKRNYSHWIPAYRNNPRRIASSLTAGMDPALIKAVYPIAVGGFLNEGLSNVIAGLDMVPASMKRGAGRTILSMLSAGALMTATSVGSGLAPKLVKRKWAAPVFVGGLVQALLQATREMVWPALKGAFGLGYFDPLTDTWETESGWEPAIPDDLDLGLGVTSTPLSWSDDVIQDVSAIELAS